MLTPTAFSCARPVMARLEIALEPVPNGLLSLSLLTSDPQGIAADPWVGQTAARMTAGQRLRNRVAFERFGDALLAVRDAPDFAAYLEALGRAHPALLREAAREVPPDLDPDVAREAEPLTRDAAALRTFLVGHLRELWDAYLKDEWQRRLPELRAGLNYLTQLRAGASATAVGLVRELTRRDVPEWAVAQLGAARRIVFALSPHAQLYVDALGDPQAAHVFARFDPAMLREAPIRPAEVLGPLSALADDTRLRLLEVLAAQGEQRGQDLIAELGASQPNVSRHLKQLVGAGFVEERRAGDANKLYRLKPGAVRALAHKLDALLEPSNARAGLQQTRSAAARDAALAAYPAALRPALDERGRVAHFSTKRAEQRLVLDYLSTKFEPGRHYTEREATRLIGEWITPAGGRHAIDAVTLRRALVDENRLRRTDTGSKYWIE